MTGARSIDRIQIWFLEGDLGSDIKTRRECSDGFSGYLELEPSTSVLAHYAPLLPPAYLAP